MFRRVQNLQGNFTDPEPMIIDDVEPERTIPSLPEDFSVDSPTFDLETYTSGFSGIVRLNRLWFVAEHCSSLEVEALCLLLDYAKSNTSNTECYKRAYFKLKGILERSSQNIEYDASRHVIQDTEWIEATNRKVAVKVDFLDQAIKSSKQNSVKDSVLCGLEELGDCYLDAGELQLAMQNYLRSRDYCISPKHIMRMCLNMIRVSIYMEKWKNALGFLRKAEHLPDLQDSSDKNNVSIMSQLYCAGGLCELATSQYKKAAQYFLKVNMDGVDYSDIVSHSCVAIYGGLCALATYDRSDLYTQCITSPVFKHFLEMESNVRDTLQSFYQSNYVQYLSLLEEMKPSLLLDVHLSAHVPSLFAEIRKRALCQYFSPYLSVDMRRMATSFNTTLTCLEEELMTLIFDGRIHARIDSFTKKLYAKDVNKRQLAFEHALGVGKDFEKKMRLILLKAAVCRANLLIKAERTPDLDITSFARIS